MLYLLSFMLSAIQLQIAYTAITPNQTNPKKRAALYPSGNFELPEIVINKAAGTFNTYHYPVPDAPFQFDEPTPSIPSYLPPLNDPPLNDLSPPYFDQTDPPNPSNEYLPPEATKSLATNMSCLDTSAGKFFRATVRLNSNVPGLNTPVIDAATVDDCLKSLNGEFIQLDLIGSKIAACGVRLCGDRSMCVRIRVPLIPGLRMLDDQQILLHCRLQEPILAGTKRFRLGPVRMLQGRGLTSGTSVTAAVGGSRQGRNFDMEVALYRQRQGSGNAPLGDVVTAGSAVYLGDELLLRAVIREGDGWKYGRLSTVTIHRASSTNNIANTNTAPAQSVTLIDEHGCNVDSMRAVCPDQPRHLGPLMVSVPFRAFAFQPPREISGSWDVPQQEEMVLSVRMVACLDAHDCVVQGCNIKPRGRTRARRYVNKKDNLNENRSALTDIETYLDFRVLLNKAHEHDYAAKVPNPVAIVGKLINPTTVLTVTSLFVFIIVGALVYLKTTQLSKSSFG